ncbi:MAG: hypothetical protein HY446_00785, partial [Candidatus Niyogibacteria bacterium]|nr:hypothetical protein [Candidatus Niyogibacteria bacterium]
MPISSFLFSGRDGLGKKTIALSFVAGLFCKEKKVSGALACGNCENCEKVTGGMHPDFTIIEGDDEIGIQQIRELKRRLALHSYAGSYRGALIDDAHLLTADAQGALLKILEEPAANSLFFLVTSHPHFLFETIRSRLLELSFMPVPEDEMRRWAAVNLPEAEDADSSVAIAEGRPGRLKRFLENPEYFREEKTRIAKFRPLIKKPLADQFLFSERMSGEGESEIGSFFQFLIGETRKDLLNGNEAGVLEKIKNLLAFYFRLETTNANARLLIDSALLELRKL